MLLVEFNNLAEIDRVVYLNFKVSTEIDLNQHSID